MDNKITNKQISLKTILDIANYFEDYKEKYEEIYRKENERNKGKSYSERDYDHEDAIVNVKYTIEFRNGQNITESNYNWFISNINNPREIKGIELSLCNSFFTKTNESNYYNTNNRMHIIVHFYDNTMIRKYSDVIISIFTTNQENESHNVYSAVRSILENTPDRYDKTIKFRNLRIQSFTISVGIILSYILYVILLLNKNKFPEEIASYLYNKNILILGQWFVAILLGNAVSYWYIYSIYKPLLPELKYAGYDSSKHKSVYTDNVGDYLNHSEVHIGNFWDAEKRRAKIEKIYKITNRILLVQLIIDVVLFLVLK